MAYLQMDGVKIPVGNFAFLSDVTGDEELFKKFYEAEKYIKVDYIDFAHKIRMAFEAFAIFEECKRRKGQKEYIDLKKEAIKEKIIEEIKQPASILNYKSIVISLCDSREAEFKEMLVKYSFLKANAYDEEAIRRFKAFIRFLYAFGSESSHENVKSEEKYVPNKENCLRVAGSFHDFLCIYYNVYKKYDSTLIPIRDYVAVPKRITDQMGLSFEKGKQLYIRKNKDKISYYILSSDTEQISNTQRRDLDTINKLWEENFEYPTNIIHQTEQISSSNKDYGFQVYSLPNKPQRLTKDLLNNLKTSDKLDIIYGLCRGVSSIHNYVTPLYLRCINPDAFYIFNIRGKYKALLAMFEYAKDTANSEFTVIQDVVNKTKNQNLNQFFAPEVIRAHLGEGVDWEKADIYSLAKTCIYILTGQIVEGEQVIDSLDKVNISDEIKIILSEMMSDDSEGRPKAEEVLRVID